MDLVLWVCLCQVKRRMQRLRHITFMDYIMQPEVCSDNASDYIGYYSTNKAADELVNPRVW